MFRTAKGFEIFRTDGKRGEKTSAMDFILAHNEIEDEIVRYLLDVVNSMLKEVGEGQAMELIGYEVGLDEVEVDIDTGTITIPEGILREEPGAMEEWKREYIESREYTNRYTREQRYQRYLELKEEFGDG